MSTKRSCFIEQPLVGHYWFSTTAQSWDKKPEFIGEIVGSHYCRANKGLNVVVKSNSPLMDNWANDFEQDDLRIISAEFYLCFPATELTKELA